MGVIDEDDIVVSGISGRLPESDNLEEFWEHLMNKDNLVTIDDRRWEPGLFGLPPRNGKLKDLSRFDATYFGVHAKQANTMDPQLRILLEVAYEAIVDGGIDPQSIRGTKTGVYIGCSVADASEAFGSDADTLVGYSVTGTNRAMLANRMSYSFDFRGPSYSVDTACSSGFMALHNAIQDMRRGDCDAAIVGASNLLVKPQSSVQFLKLGVLSPDGQSKSFDISGNGYCRSEGIVALYITRKSVCKRAYGSLVHSGTNTDGYKEQGVTYPSGDVQQSLLRQLYGEAQINIDDVEYFEAHGTGTKVGDPEETNGIAAVFCQDRTPSKPLLIGSVKSNMGHSEPTSGLAALAKVLWAFNKGIIPPNIHFNEPNPDISALKDGRMKVVTEPTPYNGGYVGVSSFGFGGSNVHVIVKPFEKSKEVETKGPSSPRLVLCASRTEEGVQEQISHLEKNQKSVELQSLYDQIANAPLNGMPYRGYTLIGSEQRSEVKQVSPPERRPIWYVFSGMGSQWAGMGKDLMVLEPFRETIDYLHDVLKKEDESMNLKGIILEGREELLQSTINSFSAIASIHVALVNCLKAIGIEPDGMIGHSVGELGCGYADESLSAEETVLAAYWRGRCVMEAELPPGAMAAIGLTWEETKQRVPPGVVPACHNAEDTVTISGDRESVEKFVAELQEEGVFARSVNSANVAFHSPHMVQIAPILLEALERVITNHRPPSNRWISTSMTSPSDDLCPPPSDMSLAAYQVNNLVSPVLFREGLAKIPDNAVTIEIAPHCLLQAILKRTLSSKVEFLSLMNRKKTNNLDFFLTNLGKLYTCGIDVNLESLYPAVDFPVSVSTPSIAPAIRWDHSQEWDIPRVEDFLKQGGSSPTVTKFTIDVSPESEDSFIKDHCIDGRVLYPATGYLCLAWRALARMKNTMPNLMPVEFKDITIHQATIVPKTGTIDLEVRIAPGSNSFEVGDGDQLAVSGKIFIPDSPLAERAPAGDSALAGAIVLEKGDVYKELRLRGYEYGPEFQGIIKVKDDGSEGTLAWSGNWVSFTDTMLQVTILNRQRGIRCLRLPTRIRRISINPTLVDVEVDGMQEMKVSVDNFTDTCRAGGVEISGLHATVAPKRHAQHAPPLVEDFCFVPYNEDNLQSKDSILKEYSSVCARYAQKVLGVTRKKFIAAGTEFPFRDVKQVVCCTFSEDELKPFLEKPEYSYLNALQKISELEKKDGILRDMLEILEEGCKDDVLMRGLVQGKHFKNALDVVWENTRSLKMKLLEIGALKGQLYPRAISCLHSQPTTELEFSIAEAEKKKLEEASEELEAMHIKSHLWDIATTPTNGLTGSDLILVDGLTRQTSNLKEALSNIHAALKDDGFVLLHDITCNQSILGANVLPFDSRAIISEQEYILAIKDHGFEVISVKSSGLLTTLFLCRKVATSITNDPSPFILNIDDETYSWVTDLQEKMLEYEEKPSKENIWLLSDRAYHSGIVGLTNCLKQEQGGERIRCIFNATPENSSLDLSQLDKHTRQIFSQDLVMNVFKNGQWGSYRHNLLETSPDNARVETCHAYVNTLTRGDLSTLRWVASPMTYMTPEQLPSDVSICSVYYASLNFRDIMLATGKLPPDALPAELAQKECILGLEFSGRLGNGRRVMGLVQSDGLATSVVAENHLLFDIPDAWSLEEAATVPVVYCTAYYALVVRGQLRKGDTVLIHSGSGGVGQAAIGIALSFGCRVFTTCGTKEKRDFLKLRFPQLSDDCFANSRDLTFEPHIMKETNGRGVDVVLNSLAAEKLEASLRLLAMHGRFLEIGKYDLSQNTGLGMALFLKNTSFHGVHLDRLMDAGNPDWPTVARLMKDGIASGVVRPLQATTFQRDDVEMAFRFMAQGKHIGKVLIQVRPEEQKMVAPLPQKFSAVAKNNCHPCRVYIITGGLGGFGLELAHWLVDRGAKNLVLTSRSGVRTGYQAHRVACWEEQGIRVLVSKRDVSRQEEAELLIRESQQMGAIGGIFNLAMVLRDGLFENQTPETFQQCCNPKVKGTANLDLVTRRLCGQELEWFVMFSSVSCGRGNAGQSNYGFANSSMERVCERRREDGLPGLAIQWGVIGDVGVVVDTMGGNETVIGGCVSQRMPSCLATLDCFLSQSSPVVSSIVPAERVDATSSQGSSVSLVDSVAHILGLSDPGSVSQDASLSDLGLDSLMGVEVKQTLERDYSIQMGMKELRQLTMRKLADLSSGGNSPTPGMDAVDAPAAANDADEGKQFAKVFSNSPSMLSASDKDTVIKMNDISIENLLPVFLLHPIEGSLSIYIEFAKQIPLPCYGVQFTPAVLNKSIPEMAAYYVEQIRKVQRHGPYRFVGLSYGACLALEMAFILEASGEEVNPLISLDGAPAYLSCHTDFFHKKFSGEKTKDGKELGKDASKDVGSLLTFAMQHTQAKWQELKEQLMDLKRSDDQYDLVKSKITEAQPDLSQEDIVFSMEGFVQRTKSCLGYNPKGKHQGDIIFVKASHGSEIMSAYGLSEDYELGKYCTGKLHISVAEGEHGTILQGPGLVTIIPTVKQALGILE